MNNDILKPVVREAVASFGNEGDGLFNVAGFQQAMRDEFDLSEMPPGSFCHGVLRSLPYVEQDGPCHYRALNGTGANR